jgi:putative ABC transport system permease protein
MWMRFYRLLLRLWPRAAREEYGDEMLHVVAQQWAEIDPTLGAASRARFWFRQYLALVRGRGAATTRGGGRVGMKTLLEGLREDIRQAVRTLMRRPGFSAVAALTLGVGIGASTSIFSAIHAVLLRPLPFGDADRIVVVVEEDRGSGELRNGTSAANMRDLAQGADLLQYAAAADPYSYDFMVDGRAESLRAWWVSEGFLETLAPTLVLGRSFTPDEYVSGEPVALLSHHSWVNRFGADPGVVGSSLELDAQEWSVIGVLPPEFDFPERVEVWTPRPEQPYDAPGRASAHMPGVAKLAPGVSLAQARAEADRVARSIEEASPGAVVDLGFRLTPIREYVFGDVRTPLWILGAAVGLVLLIACANVAGLLVARGLERTREFAVRDALGASRGRILRLMGAEAGLLAALGGVLGVGLTFAGVGAIRGLAPELPRIETIGVNGSVLVFALAATTLAALLSGLLPAVRLRHSNASTPLREGGRGASTSRGGIRLRNRLVVLEVAGAMVLLVGAGLLVKSFAALMNEELGFEPDNRLALQTFAYGYDGDGLAQFVNGTIENMMAIPGVDGVALTTSVPTADDGVLASIDIDLPFTIDGRAEPPPRQAPRGWATWVSQGLFEVLGQPVVEGRAFRITDDVNAPMVTIVNETFVRQHFGGASAVGEVINTGGQTPVAREIIGVVADTRPLGHASAPRPEIFLPLTQSGNQSLTFLIRTEVPPETVVEAARQAIWDANPQQAIWGAATLDDLVASRLVERRFNLTLLGAFALIALFLAAIGIYALVSYSVQMRRTELGIRRALGSPPAEILAMILKEGGLLGASGVVLGVGGALVATRFMRGMLFGVEPNDPGALVGLSVVVLGVSVVAALVPALRARAIDPAEALRAE